MVEAGTGICVPGNHENKLLRKLRRKNVRINHGLEQTLAELEVLPEDIREPFTREMKKFFETLVRYYVLDDGPLVVAHAGMKQEFQGRGSGKVCEFALYGQTTGEIDQFGLPIGYNWAGEYRGDTMVVYGHTPVPEAEWLNNTIDIDTGCVFGGKLTGLRYREREIVSIPALHAYCQLVKPIDGIGNSTLTSQQKIDDVLYIEDVLGKRIINTRLQQKIIIREENATAALELMSCFAGNPNWLIYLPPTMSPVETSQYYGYLEHPEEPSHYYFNK
ncbi:protein serine-threonine phosphatase [Richelia intracellularis]|nr:protein serine-threonine phosphatase [Richelia intracellularis]